MPRSFKIANQLPFTNLMQVLTKIGFMLKDIIKDAQQSADLLSSKLYAGLIIVRH
ncbi:hypothetical protein JCM19239_6822 [Vibrio variabilis]|uniref:Uncharacterized protein n=1 Tax=Vibrio variabilis TaxID=990271 RepID=A0ABQ0JN64_9VIBR|nr:hypothetical protein JCM19239_6822 [Vibrio variabilis]